MTLSRGTILAPSSFLVFAALISACGGDGTAPPPKPTKLVFLTPPSSIAETMIPLPVQPVVQTTDASGQAAGTTATISVDVISGNGTVVQSRMVGTDATGRATFAGLMLGAVNTQVGPVALRFSAPGLEPVVANVELRCAVVPLVIGQAANRTITTGDCGRNGSYQHAFRLTTSQPVTGVLLTSDASFRSGVFVQGVNEPRFGWGFVLNPGSTHLSFKALLPPGDHHVLVGAPDPGQTGAYSLRATTPDNSVDLDCFTTTLAASPITTTQSLGVFDCVTASFFQDYLVVGLPEHASITASMTSSAFEPVIKILEANSGAVIATGATSGASSAITLTNGDVATAYFLMMSSSAANTTGAYSLTLNITYPASISASSVTLPAAKAVRKRIELPGVFRRMEAGWSTSFR